MGITGLPVLILAWTIAAILFAGVVWGFPRMVGSPFAVIARILMAAVLCTAVMLAAALGLNRDNLWYTTWAQLSGDVGQAETQAKGANTTEAIGNLSSPAAVTKELPALPSPGQRVQTYTYRGAASGLEGMVMVVLPENYDAKRTYPIIEALHGLPGDPRGWTEKLKLPEELSKASAEHALTDVISVIPALEIPPGSDNQCMDSPHKIETWLTTDMRTFATEYFGAPTERAGWALMGFSAGGWCATMLGMRHPDMYGAALSMDGYTRPWFDKAAENAPYVNGPYDMVALAKANPPKMALWIQTSRDSEYYPMNKELADAVQSPLALEFNVLPTGGHRWGTWIAALPPALKWLGATAPAFAATS